MKVYLFLLISLLSSGNLIGQSKFRLGSNIGVNYSDIKAEIYNYDFGYLAGLSIEYNHREFLSIKSGINYERKTSSFNTLDILTDDDPILIDADVFRKYDYVTIPISINIFFGNSKNLFFSVGTFIGYLLKVKDSTSEGRQLQTIPTSTKIDLGFSLGIGGFIPISEKQKLSLELKNSLGLAADKINSISFAVGWTIGL